MSEIDQYLGKSKVMPLNKKVKKYSNGENKTLFYKVLYNYNIVTYYLVT